MLGHGAGGEVDAPDLLAVRAAALAAGLVVARFTQPYRVAGRRPPAPAAQLDAAWLAAVALLRRRRGTAGGRWWSGAVERSPGGLPHGERLPERPESSPWRFRPTRPGGPSAPGSTN